MLLFYRFNLTTSQSVLHPLALPSGTLKSNLSQKLLNLFHFFCQLEFKSEYRLKSGKAKSFFCQSKSGNLKIYWNIIWLNRLNSTTPNSINFMIFDKVIFDKAINLPMKNVKNLIMIFFRQRLEAMLKSWRALLLGPVSLWRQSQPLTSQIPLNECLCHVIWLLLWSFTANKCSVLYRV